MRTPIGTPGARSPLARAIGLGSAKSGLHHWWAERVSAVALVPLTLWFVASVLANLAVPHAQAVAWLHNPAVTVLMILLLVALFHHAALGLQVIVEDYIHSWVKFAAIIAVHLASYGLAVTGIVAVLKIALSR